MVPCRHDATTHAASAPLRIHHIDSMCIYIQCTNDKGTPCTCTCDTLCTKLVLVQLCSRELISVHSLCVVQVCSRDVILANNSLSISVTPQATWGRHQGNQGSQGSMPCVGLLDLYHVLDISCSEFVHRTALTHAHPPMHSTPPPAHPHTHTPAPTHAHARACLCVI